MAITSLEIKDKAFAHKFRGYDVDEVDEFLDIIVQDYEDLVRVNHEQESKIKNLEERLTYFDEMKDSLSQSVLIAQDKTLFIRLSKRPNICWMRQNTRLMKFFVKRLIMLRKWLLKQKS